MGAEETSGGNSESEDKNRLGRYNPRSYPRYYPRYNPRYYPRYYPGYNNYFYR